LATAPQLAPSPVEQSWSTILKTAATAQMSVRDFVRLARQRYLEEVLVTHRGNQCAAATVLGLHRNTVGRLISRSQIDLTRFRRRGRRAR